MSVLLYHASSIYLRTFFEDQWNGDKMCSFWRLYNNYSSRPLFKIQNKSYRQKSNLQIFKQKKNINKTKYFYEELFTLNSQDQIMDI